ncbi:alpha/beta hydrolase [Nocardioides sp. YIM 152315]|uniref:alpha/beta fold hydrolase n=1 Tax=Nocardioides sp. YIM 152315 TaxID=3031760 RepID=UPI0023D9B5D6|nr:alpha/beta hydrolase [Nocardioides sp. YIM 152315]MDF1602223.1 alpha/beta hydrolase [Nocardioides sp. YIM 152315]
MTVPISGPTRAEWRTTDGLSLIGDTWGTPDQPTVVFLHGVGQSRHAWRAAARSVAAAGFAARTFDARGHGESDWAADGDYSRPRMLLDLEPVMADLARPAVLVGFSMGGDTCLLRAASSPQTVAGVVLVDVAPHVEPDGVGPVQAFLNVSLAGFVDPADAATAVAKLNDQPPPTDVQAARRAMERHLRHDPTSSRWYWKWDPAHFENDPPLELRERELNDAARAATAPLMLVRGALSAMLSDRSVERLLDIRPDARYVNVSDAGHASSGGTNARFTDAILSFVSDVHSTTSEVGHR